MKLPLLSGFRSLGDVATGLNRLATAIASGWKVEHTVTGTHRFTDVQSTVGAAGSATAPPATPATWVHVEYVDSNGRVQAGVFPVYPSS